MRKILLLLLFLPGLALAQAKEYRSSTYTTLGWFTSGSAACQSDFAYRSTVDVSYTYNFNSYTDVNATSGQCRGTRCAKSNPSSCSTDPNQVWASTQNRTTICVSPAVWDVATQSCLTPTCPEGQKTYCGETTCKPIVSDTCTIDQCGNPNPKHNYWDGEVNQCVDNCTADEEMLASGLCVPKQVCPANTYRTSAPGEPIKCSPYKPEEPKKTCGPGEVTKGFDGQGNAICGPAPVAPDPCPEGTRNVSADPNEPNCAARSPDDPKTPPKTETTKKAPTTTTQNADGSSTETSQETVTHSDGSTSTKTTETTTHVDGSVTTNVTYTGTGGESGNGKPGSGVGDKPSAVEGDLYQKKDKTFASVLDAFNTQVNAAPFINAAKSFLSVSVNNAACPSWTVNVELLAASFDVGSYFCTPGVGTMFDIASIALLIAAAYVAFRMAFL